MPDDGPRHLTANLRSDQETDASAPYAATSASGYNRARPWRMRSTRDDGIGYSCSDFALGLELRVEPVAQRVAEQVEGEHGQADRDSREQDHPGRLLEQVVGHA